MKKYTWICLFVASSLAAIPALAGEFVLTGHISAVPSPDSDLGNWLYTMQVTWDTGTQYGLSHVDLIVDDGQQCTCAEVFESVRWQVPAGTASGEERNCRVQLMSEMNCKGDPSLDLSGSIFKFQPVECPDCHAGVTGSMTVFFFSRFPPAAIADDNLFLVDKFARYSGYGMVTGVFPSLACDPVASEDSPWGALKACYR